MAPSSLKGSVGFGIYTTRDMARHEAILAGPDGPALPVVDASRGPSHQKLARRAWFRTFDEYWWGRGVPDHVFFEADEVVDYQITFGSMPNHNCMLESIDHRYPTIPYNDALLNRFTDPGAGAISYATGREFFVSRPVQAGEELFLNYGYCKRDKNRDPNRSHGWVTDIPMPEDFREAARLYQKQWAQVQSSHNKQQKKNKKDESLVWDTNNEFVKPLLPSTVSELETLMNGFYTISNGSGGRGGRGGRDEDLAKHIARHMGTNARTVNWIKAHGLCLEHIVPGPSTIPGAGQGAIAQHYIGKGETVVPVPMLQILDRDVLTIYDEDKQPNGTQLLLNYCLGHSKTPLLLCPNTNAILMNHCSNRKPFSRHCAKGPNAVFRWSTGSWESDSKTWQAMTLDEMAKQKGRGLAMDVVALRNIQPGEEIMVDYGLDWETAWTAHTENWKPAEKTVEPWITAKEANERTGSILSAFVSNDLRKTTGHPYLFTACLYWTTEWDEDEVFAEPNDKWQELSDRDLLETYADDGKEEYRGEYRTHGDCEHWPCSVLKENGDGSYTVRIHQSDWYDTTPWEENGLPRLLTNYPRASIHYFVKPYHGDNHLKSAFRHHIGIPDELVPNQWKTLTKE